MNAPIKDFVDADTRQNMLTTLQAQRDSYIAEGYVSAETRIDRIDRAIDILVTHAEAISAAMNDDFSCRPRQRDRSDAPSPCTCCLGTCSPSWAVSACRRPVRGCARRQYRAFCARWR